MTEASVVCVPFQYFDWFPNNYGIGSVHIAPLSLFSQSSLSPFCPFFLSACSVFHCLCKKGLFCTKETFGRQPHAVLASHVAENNGAIYSFPLKVRAPWKNININAEERQQCAKGTTRHAATWCQAESRSNICSYGGRWGALASGCAGRRKRPRANGTQMRKDELQKRKKKQRKELTCNRERQTITQHWCGRDSEQETDNRTGDSLLSKDVDRVGGDGRKEWMCMYESVRETERGWKRTTAGERERQRKREGQGAIELERERGESESVSTRKLHDF